MISFNPSITAKYYGFHFIRGTIGSEKVRDLLKLFEKWRKQGRYTYKLPSIVPATSR